MRKYLVAAIILLASCKDKNKDNKPGQPAQALTEEPRVAETRTTVKPAPAAAYSEPIEDELNNWKFAVELYETKRTFHYTVRVQAKEMRVTDSINIPNFGTEPKVEIRKGKQPLTCIIGFLDTKNEFRGYREVSFLNDNLRMRTIQFYSVGHYQKKVSPPSIP